MLSFSIVFDVHIKILKKLYNRWKNKLKWELLLKMHKKVIPLDIQN